MQKITPFLWFDNQLEEAVHYYVSIFKNSRIKSINRLGESESGAPGSIVTASFQLEGQDFMGLNGGPHFAFSPAISFFVNCDSQEEVDLLWEKLSEGGAKERCGWLKDKFGVSWQIIPEVLGKLMYDKDPAKAKRVMDAMLTMDRIDIAALQKAYHQQ